MSFHSSIFFIVFSITRKEENSTIENSKFIFIVLHSRWKQLGMFCRIWYKHSLAILTGPTEVRGRTSSSAPGYFQDTALKGGLDVEAHHTKHIAHGMKHKGWATKQCHYTEEGCLWQAVDLNVQSIMQYKLFVEILDKLLSIFREWFLFVCVFFKTGFSV